MDAASDSFSIHRCVVRLDSMIARIAAHVVSNPACSTSHDVLLPHEGVIPVVPRASNPDLRVLLLEDLELLAERHDKIVNHFLLARGDTWREYILCRRGRRLVLDRGP